MTTVSAMTNGALNPDRLNGVLARVCHSAGIDHSDAELIKFTNNAVFRLVRAQVVVRIAGSSAIEGRVQKVIKVATWLAEHDVPAVRLHTRYRQPIQVDGHVATVWHLVPSVGNAPTGTDIAKVLRRWHDLPAPTFALPPWTPVHSIRERLAEPGPLRPDEHTFLLDQADMMETALDDVPFVLPQGPIWGDAFLGNLIPGPDGPVACDFDGSAYGPREWDLTPLAVGAVRFNYPNDDHALLAKAYGFDVARWDGFPILQRLRELQLVTSVLPVLSSNPSLYSQWRHRFETFKTGDSARWTPYK